MSQSSWCISPCLRSKYLKTHCIIMIVTFLVCLQRVQQLHKYILDF